MSAMLCFDPGTMIPTSGNGRKAPEIDGKWNQHSEPEDRGTIRRLPVVSYDKEQEFSRKVPKNFQLRVLLP
jgi:hypothetical protein